jgi:hypothetical protein
MVCVQYLPVQQAEVSVRDECERTLAPLPHDLTATRKRTRVRITDESNLVPLQCCPWVVRIGVSASQCRNDTLALEVKAHRYQCRISSSRRAIS